MIQELKLLRISISEVFEKMFFVYLEPGNLSFHEAGLDDGPWLKAHIEFRGPRRGTVELYMSKKLLTLMAKNMLSLRIEDVTDAEREDCAREAANMVCGNFLATMEPSRRHDLSIPLCEALAMSHDVLPPAAGRLDFMLDGSILAMTAVLTEKDSAA